eukprot:UN23333
MSRNNRPPVSLKRVASALSRKDSKGKIIVVVGTVTDDIRITDFPSKATICALRFTEGARNRIKKQRVNV